MPPRPSELFLERFPDPLTGWPMLGVGATWPAAPADCTVAVRYDGVTRLTHPRPPGRQRHATADRTGRQPRASRADSGVGRSVTARLFVRRGPRARRAEAGGQAAAALALAIHNRGPRRARRRVVDPPLVGGARPPLWRTRAETAGQTRRPRRRRPDRRALRRPTPGLAIAAGPGARLRPLAAPADVQRPHAGLQHRPALAARGNRIGPRPELPALATGAGRRRQHPPRDPRPARRVRERHANCRRPPRDQRAHRRRLEQRRRRRDRRVRRAFGPRRRPRPARARSLRRTAQRPARTRPDLLRRGQARRRRRPLRPALQAGVFAGTVTQLQLRQPLLVRPQDRVRRRRPLPPGHRRRARPRPDLARHRADRPRRPGAGGVVPLARRRRVDRRQRGGQALCADFGVEGGRRPPESPRRRVPSRDRRVRAAAGAADSHPRPARGRAARRGGRPRRARAGGHHRPRRQGLDELCRPHDVPGP